MFSIFNCSCCNSSKSSIQEHTANIIAISDISTTALKEAIKAKLNNTPPISFLELVTTVEELIKAQARQTIGTSVKPEDEMEEIKTDAGTFFEAAKFFLSIQENMDIFNESICDMPFFQDIVATEKKQYAKDLKLTSKANALLSVLDQLDGSKIETIIITNNSNLDAIEGLFPQHEQSHREIINQRPVRKFTVKYGKNTHQLTISGSTLEQHGSACNKFTELQRLIESTAQSSNEKKCIIFADDNVSSRSTMFEGYVKLDRNQKPSIFCFDLNETTQDKSGALSIKYQHATQKSGFGEVSQQSIQSLIIKATEKEEKITLVLDVDRTIVSTHIINHEETSAKWGLFTKELTKLMKAPVVTTLSPQLPLLTSV